MQHEVGAVLIDTPGVLVPKIEDSLVGLRLALVGGSIPALHCTGILTMARAQGCVREGAVPYELLADYLLFLLNRRGTQRCRFPPDVLKHTSTCRF